MATDIPARLVPILLRSAGDRARPGTIFATRSIAAATSSTLVMLYRSKVERVRWPLIAMATVSCVPDRMRFRKAVLRRS
jgi:hypothetical protein